MRKIRVILLTLTALLVFSGCGNSENKNIKEETNQSTASSAFPSDTSTTETNSEEANKQNDVPEPLKLASEQLAAGNIERAKTYLDLTMSDFKGTNAEFTARVIKSTILASECQSYSYLRNSLSKGIDNIAATLVEKSDLNRLEKTLTENLEEEKRLLKEFEETAKYILENYKEHADDELQGTKFESTITAAPSDLSFFINVGYPIPTDSEMNDTRIYAFESLLSDNLADAVSNDKLNYVNYFYLAGLNLLKMGESELTNSVMNEVLVLTESDKYNEKRIDIQEFLSSEK